MTIIHTGQKNRPPPELTPVDLKYLARMLVAWEYTPAVTIAQILCLYSDAVSNGLLKEASDTFCEEMRRDPANNVATAIIHTRREWDI